MQSGLEAPWTPRRYCNHCTAVGYPLHTSTDRKEFTGFLYSLYCRLFDKGGVRDGDSYNNSLSAPKNLFMTKSRSQAKLFFAFIRLFVYLFICLFIYVVCFLHLPLPPVGHPPVPGQWQQRRNCPRTSTGDSWFGDGLGSQVLFLSVFGQAG